MNIMYILEGAIMLEILLKSAIIYFLLLIVIKFMGKREIGQLSVFDFTVLLIISDILVSGIDKDKEFLYHVFGIILISIIQKLLAFLLLKFTKLRYVIDGKESIIILDGVLKIKEMRKQNYNVDDLIVQLRLKNVASLSEVKHMILETNGDISVFKYEDSKEVFQNEQLPIGQKKTNPASSKNEINPFPVIVSGKINKDNLNIIGKDEKWLENELKKVNKKVEEIMYANYEYGHLFIMKTDNS